MNVIIIDKKNLYIVKKHFLCFLLKIIKNKLISIKKYFLFT